MQILRLQVRHSSGHRHTVQHVFRLGVNPCVPILAIARPSPRMDQSYEMYLIIRYARHVLDIEIVVIPVHHMVTLRHTVYSRY